ncbi:hypothetical protein NX784_04250 [Massilia pinisoli]|uniref:DUF1444 family protein n=1 Tax=Massilia pinisoli TaxID=1772194 RepID=A0ABT1ZLK8_9BURK|nr:hypothetical protein [Massilia pinisoli]MCS0580794.1 hypothetical protein [Massilia pinisoli]
MYPYRTPLIAVAAMAAMAHAGAAPVPADAAAFTEFVAAQFRQQPLGGETVAMKGPLTLSIGTMQANLDRVYGYCRNNADDCQAEIDRLARGVAQVIASRNAPPAKEAVRLVVRPEEYIRQYDAAAGRKIQTWPLAGGFVIVPVLDTPRAMRTLTSDDFKHLDMNADQVFQLGVENLKTTLEPLLPQAPVARPGEIGHVAGDAYDSSRLIMHDSWAPLAEAQGGVLIVAAPAKDAVFYVGEDTPKAIDALRALTKQMMKNVPNPLSPTLLRWTKAGWEPVQ